MARWDGPASMIWRDRVGGGCRCGALLWPGVPGVIPGTCGGDALGCQALLADGLDGEVIAGLEHGAGLAVVGAGVGIEVVGLDGSGGGHGAKDRGRAVEEDGVVAIGQGALGFAVQAVDGVRLDVADQERAGGLGEIEAEVEAFILDVGVVVEGGVGLSAGWIFEVDVGDGDGGSAGELIGELVDVLIGDDVEGGGGVDRQGEVDLTKSLAQGGGAGGGRIEIRSDR